MPRWNSLSEREGELCFLRDTLRFLSIDDDSSLGTKTDDVLSATTGSAGVRFFVFSRGIATEDKSPGNGSCCVDIASGAKQASRFDVLETNPFLDRGTENFEKYIIWENISNFYLVAVLSVVLKNPWQ